MVGVTIMVNGAVAHGHLIGDLLVFGMTLLIIIRRQHETPMLTAASLSALLCPLVVWPFAQPFDITTTDLLKLLLFGTTQFGLGLVFLVIGGRLLSATENALINRSKLPLAVAWVGMGLLQRNAAWVQPRRRRHRHGRRRRPGLASQLIQCARCR
jgi:hypothetical protein